MSVSVVEEAGVDPAFEIAIQNIGQTDVLLSLGSVFDYWGCGSEKMRITVTLPDGGSRLVTCAVMSHLGEMGSLVVRYHPAQAIGFGTPSADTSWLRNRWRRSSVARRNCGSN